MTMQTVIDQVKAMRQQLEDAGWVVVNALGEQATPDLRLWLVTVYTSGEYTVEASYRDRGYGKAEGVTRIRLTPVLVQNHPDLCKDLADELVDKAAEISDGTLVADSVWPPALWSEFAK